MFRLLLPLVVLTGLGYAAYKYFARQKMNKELNENKVAQTVIHLSTVGISEAEDIIYRFKDISARTYNPHCLSEAATQLLNYKHLWRGVLHSMEFSTNYLDCEYDFSEFDTQLSSLYVASEHLPENPDHNPLPTYNVVIGLVFAYGVDAPPLQRSFETAVDLEAGLHSLRKLAESNDLFNLVGIHVMPANAFEPLTDEQMLTNFSKLKVI